MSHFATIAAVTRNTILGVCRANGALNDLPAKICSSYLLTLSTSNTLLTSARCLRLLGPQANYKSTLLSLTYFVKKFFVLFSLSQTNPSFPSGGYLYQRRNRCSKQVGLAGVAVGENMMTHALHSADLHPSSWKAFQKSAPSGHVKGKLRGTKGCGEAESATVLLFVEFGKKKPTPTQLGPNDK